MLDGRKRTRKCVSCWQMFQCSFLGRPTKRCLECAKRNLPAYKTAEQLRKKKHLYLQKYRRRNRWKIREYNREWMRRYRAGQ